jgi:hypothetical protein
MVLGCEGLCGNTFWEAQLMLYHYKSYIEKLTLRGLPNFKRVLELEGVERSHHNFPTLAFQVTPYHTGEINKELLNRLTSLLQVTIIGDGENCTILDGLELTSLQIFTLIRLLLARMVGSHDLS